MMVSRVSFFSMILTDTESEALILEATLIKKYKPKFNVRLKDDKAYPYLKIQTSEPFPRLEWTRKVLSDGARYFGPFPSAGSARQVLQLLNETFRLRDCSDNVFRHRSRPCILYQMGRCSGPCVGLKDEQGYQESIREVTRVLEGKSDELVRSLKKGMEDCAEKEEFEQAAYYRDQLRNLELITQTQGVIEAGSERNRDIVGLARKDSEAHGTIIRVRSGKMVAVQHYHLQNTEASLPTASILFDFISQYYLSLRKKEEENDPNAAGKLPEEVLVPEAPTEVDLLERTVGVAVRVSEAAQPKSPKSLNLRKSLRKNLTSDFSRWPGLTRNMP